MEERNILMARRIAESAAEAGGRAYYVGGCVRDALLGREIKDIDIEIHGLPFAAVQEILSSLGECTAMGASFGIFGLKGYDLDIALPRMEKNTGRGHRDFEVFVDPDIGPRKAASRRDFTINAMMQDILSGEILDFYSGQQDLAWGILRHVNDDSFCEDPLRVLRGAQFAARFGFSPAEETAEIFRGMDLSALPKERIMGELEKAFLKSPAPSVFFEVLKETDQLDFWFPEVSALSGIEQDPVHHPEGDVWTHTMHVLDNSAALRSAADNPLGLMLAALCHDFGKAVTTEIIHGKIHAYRHETEGIFLVRRFIRRLTNEVSLAKYVENMTELHMRPNMLVTQGSAPKSFMRLFDSSLSPNDLLLLSKADYLASCSAESYLPVESELRCRMADYEALMKQPMVQGADLIASGITPGSDFKDALAYARKLHLAGIPKETALKQIVGYLGAIRKEK